MVVKESNSRQKERKNDMTDLILTLATIPAIAFLIAVLRYEAKAVRNQPMKPLY